MKPVLKLASGDTMNFTIDATSSSVPHLQKKQQFVIVEILNFLW